MGDAIRTRAASSKPKEAPKAASKPKSAPKRNTRSIPATEKPTPIEPVAAEGKKRKERVKKTVARVLGKASIMEDEEEEEEVAAPAPKAPKLMGDAIRSGAAASKAKPAPKPKPKRNTRSIPAAEKNKPQCLRLLLRMRNKMSFGSSSPRSQTTTMPILWLRICSSGETRG